MKILFCSHEPFWPLTGGGTIGNYKIVEYLASRGNSVIVATPLFTVADKVPLRQGENLIFSSFSPFRINHFSRIRFIKYPLYAGLYFFHLLGIALTREFDCILVRNPLLIFPAWIISRIKKVPLFVSITDILSFFPGLGGLGLKLEMWVLKLADRLFVVSNAMKEICVASGIKNERIFIVFDGVDTQYFSRKAIHDQAVVALKKDLGFSEKTKIIFFHGTLELYHNIAQVCFIIEEVIKTTEASFLFVGAGKGFQELQKKFNIARVKCVFFVPYHDISRYVALADVGIVPYARSRNCDLILTLKLLEYLSMGIRVVSFDHRSISECFSAKPYVLLARDSHEYIIKIIEALEAGRCEECARLMDEEFSWDKVVEQMYAEIVNYMKGCYAV